MEIQLLINNKIERDINEFNLENIIKCEMCQIKGNENFIISIILTKNNSQCFEKAFEVLRNIKAYLEEKDISFYEINNECSAYFQRVLYPKIQKFKCNLRKLIQIAMCDAEEVLNKAYDDLSKNVERKKQVVVRKYGLLNATNLNEIFEFLFVDKGMLQELKDKITEHNFHLMNDLKEVKFNSLWNTIFKDKYVGFELDKYCDVLYNIRNDVMHFHSFDYKYYKESLKIVNKLNKQLEMQLDKNVVLELKDYKDSKIIETNIYYNFKYMLDLCNKFTKSSIIKLLLNELTNATSNFRKILQPLQLENNMIRNIANILENYNFRNDLNFINNLSSNILLRDPIITSDLLLNNLAINCLYNDKNDNKDIEDNKDIDDNKGINDKKEVSNEIDVNDKKD